MQIKENTLKLKNRTIIFVFFIAKEKKQNIYNIVFFKYI